MNLLQILLLALFATFVVLRLLGRHRAASRFARWTLLGLGAVVVLAPFHLAGGSGVQGSLGAQ
jgi:Na+/glutamate symporter